MSNKMRVYSRYLSAHQQRDGHLVSTTQEVDELATHTEEIIKFSINAFVEKYGKL